MKRFFDELSDDESNMPRVKVSLVLGSPQMNAGKTSNHLPPLESFSFKPKSNVAEAAQNSASSLEDDDMVARRRNSRRRKPVFVDYCSTDEEFDPVQEKRISTKEIGRNAEGKKEFIGENAINLADDEEIARVLQEDELVNLEQHPDTADLETSDGQNDLINSTLQKCDEIAASLRKELDINSSSKASVAVDRYAEVDGAALKIVTQADVSAACGIPESNRHHILKPYQLVGVNFLLLLYRKKVGGAILADEMGLGKTIQAIAFLAILNYLERDSGPHMVVCPASLLENWQRELKKWFPSFTVILYHGTGRTALFNKLTYSAKAGEPAPFNVMLTCYSSFERHSSQQKDDRKLFRRFDWSCMLMDEAHLLKDRGSYRRKNLWAVAQKANQRLLMTGTPLQNDLQELWSLLEFMVPNIFDSGNWDLKKLFGNKGAASDTTVDNMDLISHIKAILGPFVLRRLKSDVMRQLVPKIQKVEFLEMQTEQDMAYKEAVEEYRTVALNEISTKKLDLAMDNAIGVLPRRQITNYFTKFRKIANHPLLVRRIYTEGDVASLAIKLHSLGAFGFDCTLKRVQEELMTYSDFALHKLSTSYVGIGKRGALSDSYALASAKCQALARLLPKIKREGHRPLIFSQWTGMMDILEWALEVLGFQYARLDGSTQVSERQNIVDSYNNDPNIFACLLSTRAGGQGLNLTGADTVIIHDLDFNPQIDRQAEDRCHRIGQTKPVTVYRLVTKGTVDENIYGIAKRKLVLDAAVLESGVETLNDNNESDARAMGEILAAILSASPS